MQEHAVLDVLSATNHAWWAGSAVCLPSETANNHEQEPSYLHDSKLTRVTKCQNSSLIAASENYICTIPGCARQDIRFESGVNAEVIAKPDDVSSNSLLHAQFWIYTVPFEKRALFQSIRFMLKMLADTKSIMPNMEQCCMIAYIDETHSKTPLFPLFPSSFSFIRFLFLIYIITNSS